MKPKYFLHLSLIFAGVPVVFSQVALNPVASRALGQPNLIPKTGNPNWVDGRELFQPEGVVLDTSTTPPGIYVADTGNNRVLAWKNATGFTNGQPADLIIGQPDNFTTTPGGGPSATYSTGLNQPIGVAVLNGDLFVADTGNNRILRYRSPLSKQTGNIFPDLWLGQPSLSTNTANYTGALSAQGLKLSGAQSYLAIDPQGNLWVSDAGNGRVLRFPASAFSCSNCGASASNAADIVIGAPNLTSAYPSFDLTNPASAVIGNQFNVPAGLAFDSAGRLYVTDDGVNDIPRPRARIYAPVSTRRSDFRHAHHGRLLADQPIHQLAVSIYDFDCSVERLLLSRSKRRRRRFRQQSDSGFSCFRAMARSQHGLFAAGDCRLRAKRLRQPRSESGARLPPWSPRRHPQPPCPIPRPLLLESHQRALPLGFVQQPRDRAPDPAQLTIRSSTPPACSVKTASPPAPLTCSKAANFSFHGSTSAGSLYDAGIAIDSTGSVPHLYVSDPGNHRVLAYKDMRSLNFNARADLVIGQPDGATALCNYPTGDSAQPTQTQPLRPKGTSGRFAGNLYVADSGNGRVLRFPAPFSQPAEPDADCRSRPGPS